MSKMSVDISGDVDKLLEKIAKREDRTKCAILRRALGLYSYMSDQCRRPLKGKYIAVLDKDENIITIIEWK
jgi:hypothetical protein